MTAKFVGAWKIVFLYADKSPIVCHANQQTAAAFTI